MQGGEKIKIFNFERMLFYTDCEGRIYFGFDRHSYFCDIYCSFLPVTMSVVEVTCSKTFQPYPHNLANGLALKD